MDCFTRFTPCFAGVLVMLLWLNAPAANAQLFNKKCKAPSVPQPQWVENPGSLPSGHRYGTGSADYQKGQPYQKQLTLAKTQARADLSNQLLVAVKTEMERTVTSQSGAVKTDVRQRIVNESDLEIPSVETQQIWQNPKNCRLHTLVALPQATAILVTKKAELNQYANQAKNAALARATRQAALHNAMAIAKRYEFGRLPNSSASAELLREFTALQQQFTQSQASRRNAVMFMGKAEDQAIVQQVLPRINQHIAGSFLAGQCNSMGDCVQQATQTGAQYITIARAELPILQQGGLYVGQFSLTIELRDLRTGQSLMRTPAGQTVPVMNHSQYKVTMHSGIRRWLQKFPQGLAGLATAI